MHKVLNIENLIMEFGGLKAVNDVNLDVTKGEIVALIGPNGAGKTTIFNCITGVYKPTAGDVFISPKETETENITNKNSHVVTHKGIARTFQNIRLFKKMTVLENVMIGRHTRLKSGILSSLLHTPAHKKEEAEVIEKSYEYLEKLDLEKYANELATNLPYGAQRRLEIARALATEPFLLFLDEPAAGMNPQETRELDDLILKIRDSEDISILLIEHDMNLVMSLSERIFVIDYGVLIAEGTPDEIKNNSTVIKAYLGEEF
jgi:branched-chain amino acid transport system ATP-binding protein